MTPLQPEPARNAVADGVQTASRARIYPGKVCVSVSGTEMIQVVAGLAHAANFVEFRLDSLPDPGAFLPGMASFLAKHPGCTAIATCRRIESGGKFAGSPAAELEILAAAAEAGAHLLDLSLETAEALDSDWRARLSPAHLLLSWHDFAGTPPLPPVYERMRRWKPDLYKIVPTACSLTDNIAVFDLLETHAAEGNLIAMAMGQAGLPSRILGPRFGSAFTFASPDENSATAPGQVSAQTLTDLYRIGTIDIGTQVFGVAGKPIRGSLSPLMHNRAFQRERMNAVYLPLETDSIDDLLRLLKRIPLSGVSLTMPLKQAVLPYLHAVDPLCALTGACNTVVIRDGTLSGFNTDVDGILGPLQRRIPLRGATALVLGAGGAARAAVFGLGDRGAKVAILNRTRATAQQLAQASGAEVQSRESLAGAHFDVIVNATAFGLLGEDADPPVTAAEMNCRIFFDLVYNPIETTTAPRSSRQRNRRDRGLGDVYRARHPAVYAIHRPARTARGNDADGPSLPRRRATKGEWARGATGERIIRCTRVQLSPSKAFVVELRAAHRLLRLTRDARR